MIPSTAIADPGLRLVHQLLGAYCTTQCGPLITSLRDQITAHLADECTRVERAEDMVMAVVGLGAQTFREHVEVSGRTPGGWRVDAPPGQHRHNPSAYQTAESTLNDAINDRDPRPLLRTVLELTSHRVAVDLVCEATWLARIVVANTAGRP